MKTIYRPLMAKAVSDDEFIFTNTNSFKSSAYLDIKWELYRDGELKADGALDLDIPALESRKVKIDLPPLTDENSWHINFVYHDGDRHVATEQLTLRDVPIEYEFEITDSISASRENEFLQSTLRAARLYSTPRLASLLPM